MEPRTAAGGAVKRSHAQKLASSMTEWKTMKSAIRPVWTDEGVQLRIILDNNTRFHTGCVDY